MAQRDDDRSQRRSAPARRSEGRVPPHNLSAEESLLGALLLSREVVGNVAELGLQVDHFYKPAHQHVYAAIRGLMATGQPVDVVTVADELRRSGLLDEIGGAQLLLELQNATPAISNANRYAKIVQDTAVLRKMISVASEIAELAYMEPDDVTKALDEAETKVFEVAEDRVIDSTRPLGDLLPLAMDKLQETFDRGDTITGTATGFNDLDEILSGLQPSTLNIIGARPAMGKCVAWDTPMVHPISGEIRTAEEWFEVGSSGQSVACSTLDDSGALRITEFAGFYHDGLKAVFQVRTRSGRQIRLTAAHPLLTGRGWQPLESIAVGTRIAVPTVAHDGTRVSIDTLPLDVWDDVMKAKGDRSWADVSRAASRPARHNWHPYRRRPRRETIGRLAEVLDCDVLRRWASPDVSWDAIVAIEPCGLDRVYDFNVPGTHNFVAADVFVHNTAFGLGIATHIAMTAKKPVLFFSLEMGHAELTQRILSSEARVDSQKLRSGRLVDSDWTKIGRAINRLEVPLLLDDNPRVTVMEIRAKARRTKARYGGLGLIVVDYLQLMGGSTSAENRQLEVSEISRGLKILARELETPIIALSQLSRNLETRGDKRPMLADLRESGCLTADTRLVRADTNSEVTLGELVRDGVVDIPVWSLDERYRLVPAQLVSAFPSGVKETFLLRLASGRRIQASANHPFLTVSGWTPVEHLAVGDHIAAARTLPDTSSPATMTDDHLILLGHLIGDGCTLDRHAVQYTTTDPDNVSAVTEAAARQFGVTARVRAEHRWTQVYLPSPIRLTHGRHHPISVWLRSLGAWNLRSYEKAVPREVFAQPCSKVALFLRHLWATDGSVSTNRRSQQLHIYYATSSRQLADDVMNLLLRLDIRARLTVVPSRRGRTGYHVSISGRDQQLLFAQVVGVHGAHGRTLEAALAVLRGKVTNTNVDIIPAEVWNYVRSKSLPAAGLTARQLAERLGMQYSGSALYRSGLSRERCGRLALATDDVWLHDLAASDVLWDRIAEITPLGEQEVFDATIEGTHNFVANGLIAHNSLEQDADVVMFIYRDEIYNRESPDKGSAEVILAKHRSGPTGVVRLVFNGAYTRFDNAAKGLH